VAQANAIDVPGVASCEPSRGETVQYVRPAATIPRLAGTAVALIRLSSGVQLAGLGGRGCPKRNSKSVFGAMMTPVFQPDAGLLADH